MTTGLSVTFNLDRQGFYPLTCHYDPEKHCLRVVFDHEKLQAATPRFRHNLFKRLTANNAAGIIDTATSALTFNNFSGLPASLAIAGRHIAMLGTENSALVAKDLIPLSVSHKRIIGTYHAATLQNFALGQNYNPKTFQAQLAQATSSITGDFHTHSSANISAGALLDIAIRHHARYPLHLLEDIGVHLSEERKKGKIEKSPRVKFPPLEPQNLPDEVDTIPLEILTREERLTLERSMVIKDTEIQTFAETEVPAYQMRYPLTKNPELLQDLIREMVRENQRAGIKVVELSYVALEDPAIFRAVHEVLHDLQNHDDTKDVRVFLKYGIPRTHDVKKIEELLEKAKVITQSPYVTGIDLLGYEDNKADQFSVSVKKFAAWAKQHAPGLMLAVHAGENDKNHNNVKDALKLAQDTGLPVRIGHGIHGVDEEAISIAKSILERNKLGVVFELNPESNIALNNIMDAQGLTYKQLIDSNIPFVPGSDSFGQYQTSRTDLAQTFIDAGFSTENFAQMAKHQQALSQHLQKKHDASMKAAGDFNTYVNTACAALQAIPSKNIQPRPRINDAAIREYLEPQGVTLIEDTKKLPKELEGKKVVTLVGASGSSWERIDPGHQREIAITCDMLAHALDPEKVCFAQGRNKNSGLSKVLNGAIAAVNNGHSGSKSFQNVGFQADIEMRDNDFPYGHLTHMIAIPKRTAVADTIADFTTAHDGILIAMGGAAYTRDTLLKADIRTREQNKGFVYTMKGPAGASSDKARGMDTEYVFMNGKELLKQVFAAHQNYFRPGLDSAREQTLEQLHQEAADRIGNSYGTPGSNGQIVLAVTDQRRGENLTK
jgi:hypothetical protein